VKIRFQADADLNEDIVAGVRRREPGIDFQTAEEAGLRGLVDERVLELAAADGRTLVTHAAERCLVSLRPSLLLGRVPAWR